MKSLFEIPLIGFVLVLAPFAFATSFLDFVPAKNSSSVQCVHPGQVCSSSYQDCGKIFFCLPNGENQWNIIESQCADGFTCNQGQCSRRKTPLCAYGDVDFHCNTIGMFPDPISCKKYNFCVPNATEPILFTAECDKSHAYNPATTFCDIPLADDACTENEDVFGNVCENLGDNAAIIGNDVLYYICLPYNSTLPRLYPHLNKCPNGKRYLGNYICEQ